MADTRIRAAAALVLCATALAACVSGQPGFGGVGGVEGDNRPGLSLARDACTRAAEERGRQVVRILSAFETQGGAQALLEVRRDAMSLSTQRLRCEFDYGTGRARLHSA